MKNSIYLLVTIFLMAAMCPLANAIPRVVCESAAAIQCIDSRKDAIEKINKAIQNLEPTPTEGTAPIITVGKTDTGFCSTLICLTVY